MILLFPVYSLECLATWPGNSRTYFIARQPGKDTRLVNCFVSYYVSQAIKRPPRSILDNRAAILWVLDILGS